MNQQRPSRRGPSHLHGVCTCAVVCAAFLFAGLNANAQDIADAARQENARKAAQKRKPAHVYTNEDLQREQILTPEDRAPIEAGKKNTVPATPGGNETSPAVAPVQDAAATESLGEIARRMRQEKAARQAEQAHHVSPPAAFPVELPQEPVLAHPMPLSQPLIVLVPSVPKISKPSIPAGTVKRDPFSRVIISAAPRTPLAAPAPVMKTVPPTAPMHTVVAPPLPPKPTVVAPPTPPVPSTPVHAPSVDTKTRPQTVLVQTGDSLWNLSRRYLGKGSQWQKWLSHNPAIGDPRRMQPGAVLAVPLAESQPASPSWSRAGLPIGARAPGAIPVQAGDSLWSIAAKQFGRGADWPCLAHANPDLRDVNRIYPGQVLQLPVSCTAARSPSSSE